MSCLPTDNADGAHVPMRLGNGGAQRLPPGTPITGPALARTIIGTFAEDYVAGLLPGAQPWPNTATYAVPPAVATDEWGGQIDLYPDLWRPQQRQLVEVKAAMQGRQGWYVAERQLRSYLWLTGDGDRAPTDDAHGDPVPLPGPSVLYALVCYRLPEGLAPGRCRTAAGLVEALTPNGETGLRRVLLLPVELLAAACVWGSTQDHFTPLSELLGAWRARRRAPCGRLWALWGKDPTAALGAAVGPNRGYSARRWVAPDGVEVALVEPPPRPAWVGPLRGAARDLPFCAWGDGADSPF